MQIINNTNGLFENIYFQDDTIEKSIKNHRELLEIIIPKCDKVLIASPFLMNSFEDFFKNVNIHNIEFELITTCKPKGNEQIVKPFQMKDFGVTIKKFTTQWPKIHLINSLHSKIYLFYKHNSIILGIVTSANFTNNGLLHNHETGVVLSDNKILKNLELDIQKHLEYISLSESKINNLCTIADTIKKDNQYEKQEDIDINLSKHLENNMVRSEENIKSDDIEILLDDFILCKECGERKNKNEFSYANIHRTKKGLGTCRSCKYFQTDFSRNGLGNRFYNKLLKRANEKEIVLNFKQDEFKKWLLNHQYFIKLYSEYEANIKNNDLKPSFYLINKQDDYSLENIKLCTSKEAHERYMQSMINNGGEITIQLTLANEPLQIYESANEASRQTKITDNSIINCCNGKGKTAGGYTWIYLKNTNDNILDKLEKIEKVNQCFVDDEDFLLELASTEKLEIYIQTILFYRSYINQDIEDKITNKLLVNADENVQKLFQKDIPELAEEVNSNYVKIEVENFDYFYGLVNIRYAENENSPIFKILKIIAKNTMSKQLIEFLMENKTKQEILIAIIANRNKEKNDDYIVDLKVVRRALEYAIKLDDIQIVKKILSREEISSEIIRRVLKKFENDITIISILLATNYFDERINKWLHKKFENNEIKKNINTQLAKVHTVEENDDILKKLLIELRDKDIKKEFEIDEKCILSDSMIQKFIIYKPITITEFRDNIPNKDIDIKQVKFLDKIFEIIEMTE